MENNIGEQIHQNLLKAFPNAVEYGDGQALQMFLDVAKQAKEKDIQQAGKSLYELLELYKSSILLENFRLVSAKILAVSDNGMVQVELFSNVTPVESNSIAPSTFSVGGWSIYNASIYQNLKVDDNVVLLIPGKSQSSNLAFIIGVHSPNDTHLLNMRTSLAKLPELVLTVVEQEKKINDLQKKIDDLNNKVNNIVEKINSTPTV